MLDPSSTSLPVRAAFLPWLADMVTVRLAAPADEVGAPIEVRPGASVTLPQSASALELNSGQRRAVSGPTIAAPAQRGIWWILNGSRRIGALVVAASPDESALGRFNAGDLAARVGGHSARASVTVTDFANAVYASGSSRPALVPLLMLALLLLTAESAVVRSSRSAA
ncbi:MAG: hypothetical protein H0W68_11230 [Gemmatimonadaceae bacterium]|nr:hypothetical protein [Gemmatimonadaceae bacterium]